MEAYKQQQAIIAAEKEYTRIYAQENYSKMKEKRQTATHTLSDAYVKIQLTKRNKNASVSPETIQLKHKSLENFRLSKHYKQQIKQLEEQNGESNTQQSDRAA